MKKFYDVFSPQNVVYVFAIPDAAHRGLLKIGKTTFNGDTDADAKRRINEYTRNASIRYDLLHSELAVTDRGESFDDHEVHEVLTNSGYKRRDPNNTGAREWFKATLPDVIAAIAAVKRGEHFIKRTGKKFIPVTFRDEQAEAIGRTVKHFGKFNKFLWNAKMRFGKTLCALEVVRRMKFAKTIIITHRPDVKAGWFDDFRKIFGGTENFDCGRRGDFDGLIAGGKRFVYFASIQDLRGSELVNSDKGRDKNAEIFSTEWDCVIVDEAHEGTQTALGDAVIKNLVKPQTKFLALSGTPFNIIDDYDEDQIYTWDYIMEQRAKNFWATNHPDKPNPYAKLPRMNIYTYDLGELFDYVKDGVFNFEEFFRTDGETFAHEDDVKNFLDLLTRREDNNYPYANENFRDMFSHTLWVIPGVKEGRALSRLLKNHRVFGSFKIVNVTGDGDRDDEPANALDKVQNAIDEHGCTITLTCGKLTAGVTVPKWTAVFMLKGGSSAMNYLQTIFRVQSPWSVGGRVKQNCYVFDFAPDRTLKVVAEGAAVSARAGKTTASDRKTLEEFFKFCPVIAMRGSRMKEINSTDLLRQLKSACAERAVRSGFADNSLYTDELLKLTEIDTENLIKLAKSVGKTDNPRRDVTVNDQGVTAKVTKQLREKLEREPTPEEIEESRRRRQKYEAIKILRGISVRMPLIIYGADIPFNDDVPIEKFADLIDDDSWTEFMPKGVTKKFFAEFIKFYDPEVFIEAGHRIRARAARADELPPIDRAKKIAELFATFKNPDKETVLTPWRVVNMHMNALPKDTFAPDKKILDINAKTGLYPLWITMKIFYARTAPLRSLTLEQQRLIWDAVVIKNIFVVCKTPMAVKITRRTLLGYRTGKVNAEFLPDLVDRLKNNPAAVVADIIKKFFGSKGVGTVKFDAVVGNPPYQIAVDGDNKNYASPVYHLFMDAAFKLADRVSLIHPARCLFNAGDVPKEFKQRLLADPHFKVIERYDSQELFPTSDIKGGVAITLRDANENFGAIGTFTEFEEMDPILCKVVAAENFQSFKEIVHTPVAYRLSKKFFSERADLVCKLQKPNDSALRTNIFERLTEILFDDKPNDGHEYIQILGRVDSQRAYKWIRRDYITAPAPLDKFKVIIPKANGTGEFGEVFSSPFVELPNAACTQTFMPIGAFDTRTEADACLKYIKSKFARALLGVLKVTQDNPPSTWAKVPLQNFTATSDIDWTVSIAELDAQLYRKYGLTDAEIEFIESHVRAMD